MVTVMEVVSFTFWLKFLLCYALVARGGRGQLMAQLRCTVVGSESGPGKQEARNDDHSGRQFWLPIFGGRFLTPQRCPDSAPVREPFSSLGVTRSVVFYGSVRGFQVGPVSNSMVHLCLLG